jgi:hypothetical protein
VIAVGSLGSMAGLIQGTWASGLDCRVHGYIYTAKAMAGLIQGIRVGTYTHRDRVVYFHTDRLAGFFAAAATLAHRQRRHRLHGGSH